MRRCGPRATRPAPWLRANAPRRRWNRGPRDEVLRVWVLASRAQALIAHRAVRAVPGRRRGGHRAGARRAGPLATPSRPASRWPRRLPVGATSTAVSPSCTGASRRRWPPTRSRPSCAATGTSRSCTPRRASCARSWRWRRRASSTCRRFGPLLLVAPTLAENWVHALVATGRWDDAAGAGAGARTAVGRRGHGADPAPPARPGGGGPGRRTRLRGRDGHHRAGSRARTTRTPCTTSPLASAEHLLWQGEAQEAHRISREALDQLGEQQDAGLVVSMCSVALRAHADVVTSQG